MEQRLPCCSSIGRRQHQLFSIYVCEACSRLGAMCSRVLTIGHATTRKTRLLPTSAVATSAKERSRKKKYHASYARLFAKTFFENQSVDRRIAKEQSFNRANTWTRVLLASWIPSCCYIVIKSSYPQPGVALIVRRVFSMCSSSTSVTEALAILGK